MSDHLADDIIDRRRLRRKLTFWRVIAVGVALAGLFAIALAALPEDRFGPKSRPHVAKVRIEGVIVEDEDLIQMLEDIAESEAAKGVILAIDSPGGTTAGGEAVYEAVRRLAETKPVTAQIGTTGASAAYMVAAAADFIVARKTSIVGSIGVIVQYPNVTEMLKKLGIDMQTIKSTPLKGEPSMFGEPVPGAEEMMRAMLLDSYQWFKDLVRERRDFSETEIDRIADGSVFSGRQALANRLVDDLGGEEAARNWLTGQGVDEELDIVEWKKAEPAPNLFWARAAAQWLGLAPGKKSPVDAIQERLFLDGMISVWHVGR
ncbi:signal peptide peptidase SppA [Oricola thermophila]|uniref:Signal peptide peptidase SppA n=1 Tax=Oricola thermophila TaxID=2742145 RepID=A0A6N1VIK5_9HYPH|nr:signal peptide peptidase SppA [Oricola thermophila]QKV19555.1 signal peptide peptidase SppA [Oricola thermophila]